MTLTESVCHCWQSLDKGSRQPAGIVFRYHSEELFGRTAVRLSGLAFRTGVN